MKNQILFKFDWKLNTKIISNYKLYAMVMYYFFERNLSRASFVATWITTDKRMPIERTSNSVKIVPSPHEPTKFHCVWTGWLLLSFFAACILYSGWGEVRTYAALVGDGESERRESGLCARVCVRRARKMLGELIVPIKKWRIKREN